MHLKARSGSIVFGVCPVRNLHHVAALLHDRVTQYRVPYLILHDFSSDPVRTFHQLWGDSRYASLRWTWSWCYKFLKPDDDRSHREISLCLEPGDGGRVGSSFSMVERFRKLSLIFLVNTSAYLASLGWS